MLRHSVVASQSLLMIVRASLVRTGCDRSRNHDRDCGQHCDEYLEHRVLLLSLVRDNFHRPSKQYGTFLYNVQVLAHLPVWCAENAIAQFLAAPPAPIAIVGR